jgi:hypothetical protein
LRGLLLLALVVGCGPKAPDGPPIGTSTKEGTSHLPSDKPIAYAFDALDERGVSSEAFRGKPTILAFVTTGDFTSQAQVDFLVAMEKNDGKLVNYALVALHPRKEIVLVETYARTLNVTFPVALGDGAAMGPAGPFGEIPAVPTVVLLDRKGRLVWKHTNLAKPDEIRAHLRGL